MPFIVNLCKCSPILNPILPLSNSPSPIIVHSTAAPFPATTPKPYSASYSYPTLSSSSSVRRLVQVEFCSNNETIQESRSTRLPARREIDEIGLLNKPSPKPICDQSENETQKESEKRSKDEILEPFRRLFKPTESLDEKTVSGVGIKKDEQEGNQVSVEYFEPKLGDFVLGVVVSGNGKKLDVNIGADLLGVMLTKDVLPLDSKEMGHLLCDLEKDAERVMVGGNVGILKNDVAFSGEPKPTQPVVDPGTVLFAEVLGRTLSGRPLLSSRKFFRRIAWHRVRQIKDLNEPIEVKFTEWNTGGLLTKIEGLRAFLPKSELMNRVKSFTELKENVGRRMHVLITRINEETNDLVLNEKEAWNMLNLQEGTLLEGTVLKIFPYGAQVGIGNTNRSGLLHISNITKGQVSSVGDFLAVNEKIKALVVKSPIPGKVSLSTAVLESEPGLFLLNREKVFSEAEEMAKRYRQRNISAAAAAAAGTTTDVLPFEDEERMYANWEWFKFEKGQLQ